MAWHWVFGDARQGRASARTDEGTSPATYRVDPTIVVIVLLRECLGEVAVSSEGKGMAVVRTGET